jgi:RNA polymerase sigma factor (sigma-70 family)
MYEVLDGDLLAAARNGQQEAFTDLYRRHVDAARREARRRCRRPAAADDAVASAFASVFRAVMSGGGPTDHFRAYLLTAVRNAVIDQSRRRDVEDVPFPETELPDESIAAPDLAPLGASLGAAFLTLPDRQREALWKTEVEGRTNPEMAGLLGLTENAFAALKKRARQNLSTAYERELIGGDGLCTWIGDRVSVIVAGELGHSHRLMVDLHLDSCDACCALVPDRERTTAPLLGLPLLLAAPVIRRLRGRVPTWWSGARGARLAATGPRHAATLVGLVAGGAAVVGLVFGGGEPRQTIAEEGSTAVGVSTGFSGSATIEERVGGQAVENVALHHRTASRPDGDDYPAIVVVNDREHRRIAGARATLDDDATGPAEGSASDDGGVADGPSSDADVLTGGSTAAEPAAPSSAPAPETSSDEPSDGLPSDESPTDTTTVPVLISTTAATTTTTSPATTTVPQLIGTIATTTTTVPQLIGAIATTTTAAPLIGTIATTTTTAAPLIGTISP